MQSQAYSKREWIQVITDLAGCTSEKKEDSIQLKSLLSSELKCTWEMVGQKEQLGSRGLTDVIARAPALTGCEIITQQ